MVDEPQKGPRLAEGKTKIIWSVAGDFSMVIVENKDDITAHDNPDETRQFASKAELATTTTCRMFELLRYAGVPVAYERQLSPTMFLARKSNMVPLECVSRRYAVGSSLKRMPHLATDDPKSPHRFHRLVTEVFLKTTDAEWQGQALPCDDPLIVNAMSEDEQWVLAHPKKPHWIWNEENPNPFNGLIVDPKDVCPDGVDPVEFMQKTDRLLRKTSLVIEKAWAMLGLDWIDMKIEVDDQGFVSDVVDSDSWRLWRNGEAYDKQVFRDGGEAVLGEVEAKYGTIARLAEQLRIPTQAVVIWRGSDKDEYSEIDILDTYGLNSVDVVDIICSGHKSPIKACNTLENVLAQYPQGGVLIALVGKSNGLGSILSARTSWPVISVCATHKTRPHDAWSSLEVPSKTPNLTMLSLANAVDAALRILSRDNPEVYAWIQGRIEGLDN